MSDSWVERPEGGSRLAFGLIRTIAEVVGRGPTRLLLWPITAYYVLARGPERRASRDYLSRVLGRPARWRDVFRHVHVFSATILDRVFLLGGELARFDLRVDGVEQLVEQLDHGRGVLMFGSHLGSFEVLRMLAIQRPQVQLRVVLDVGHNPALTQLLDSLNPGVAKTVIDAGQDGPSLLLAIKEATDAGALVAMLVDRIQPGQASHPASFLGGTARFPAAPWLVASVLKVPVLLGFGLYRGGNRYDLVFEMFDPCIRIERRQRQHALQAIIQRYADRLQHHVRNAPYNWFNFYDFWQPEDEAIDPVPAPGAAGRAMAGGTVVAGERVGGERG
ncbi:acyltransferase [Novilysobacter antarcticus]|uniref:LpxL/LpxP family acyltransferase n=1 Tax=Novilysobacter antarcticus TaxID=2862543 RepID=UPI001C9915CB